MLATAAIVIAVVIIGITIAGYRARELPVSAAGLFVFVLGWLYALPTAAAKITGSYVYRVDNFGNLEVAGLGWADGLYRLVDVTTVVIAVVAIIASVSRGAIQWGRMGVVISILLFYVVMVTSFSDARTPSLNTVQLLLAVVAATLMRARIASVAAGGLLFAVTFFTAGAVLAVSSPATAIAACDEKCTVFGAILVGAAPHGNTLGLVLTFALPLAWLSLRGRRRLWMVVALLVAVSATGSRTSLAVAIGAALALWVCRVNRDGDVATVHRPILLLTGTLAVSAASLILPFTGQRDDFATGRGYLWRIALEIWKETPIFGSGSHAWERVQQSGTIALEAAYSTHNQWLEVLLFGGIVGGVLFGVAIIVGLIGDGTKSIAAVAPVLIVMMLLGGFERPISVNLMNSMSWALVALVLLARSQQFLTGDPTDISQSSATTPRPGRVSQTTARMGR